MSSSSSSDLTTSQPKSESSTSTGEDLSKHLKVLFVDDQGHVPIKHCILKKEPTYNGYGLVLRYQSGLHLIDQVEVDSPAFNAGLREDDIILFTNKKNVEQMTHDDVKGLIRNLSISNIDVELILIKKSNVQRYKNYQTNHSIDWAPILEDESNNATIQSRQITYRRRSDYKKK